MKIEILGRHIEIDDADVIKEFEYKYNKYKYLEMDKDEFIQRGLDYFEHALKDNVLYALNSNLGIAISTFKRIAGEYYEDIISPFTKPGYEMEYITRGSTLKDDDVFFEKYYLGNKEKNNSENENKN